MPPARISHSRIEQSLISQLPRGPIHQQGLPRIGETLGIGSFTLSRPTRRVKMKTRTALVLAMAAALIAGVGFAGDRHLGIRLGELQSRLDGIRNRSG